MPQLTGFPRVPIPGPAAFPLVGTMPRFVSFLDDPVATVLALRGRGEVVAVVDQNPAIVCVFGPERNREVLAAPGTFRNPEDFFQGPPGSARDKMRAMLVTTNGETHRRNRRLMMPAFQRSALDGYADEITQLTRDLVDGWPTGEVVAVDALCRELALCIAVRCFYGVDVKEGARELGRAMAEFVEIITAPLNILLPLNVPGLPYHRGVQLGEELSARMMALVDTKRRAGGVQRDAMGLLLAARDDAGNGLSDDEIVAFAVELFIAGSETTSMTVTWVLLLLDQHPDVLDAVSAELREVLGDRMPTPADLPRLGLLDRVVKESMRVLPTAPVLFLRAATADTTVGGFPLPKDANVLVSPLASHHDPTYFPEPRRFLPERWITADPPPFTYMPFGAGPRMCVGALFAEQSIRLQLALILRRHHPRSEAGSRIDRRTRGNILHARDGVHMRIHPASSASRPAVPVTGNIHELVALPGGPDRAS